MKPAEKVSEGFVADEPEIWSVLDVLLSQLCRMCFTTPDVGLQIHTPCRARAANPPNPQLLMHKRGTCWVFASLPSS